MVGSIEKKLRVYANDVEWWVAYDKDDLRALVESVVGYRPDEDWEEEDPAEQFTMQFETDMKEEAQCAQRALSDGGHAFVGYSQDNDPTIYVRASFASWAAINGRGFLATTEW